MDVATRHRRAEQSALIIATDPARRASLGRWVHRAGFAARAAESAEKAQAELADRRFDLVLTNPAVLDPAALAPPAGTAAAPAGPSPVLGACVDPTDGDGDRVGEPGLSRFGGLIGRSTAMQRVYDPLLRVATTAATVFLIGESGTGKELAAELIHALSRRAARPFVAVNCGAFSPALVESELFGHERGSFTGADRRRAGLFERARGGTLFLDEVTEMSLDLQAKLLRVLESGTLHRVGGSEPVDVDVRVIAATNRDPEEAVAAGRFREDLLYRLLVFPIRLPPLRRRLEDVPLIARHYLDRLNRQGSTRKAFSDEAGRRLASHGWPGNVRELRNAVERAFILAEEEIHPQCLGLDPAGPGRGGVEDLGVRVGMPIAEVERRLILATLARLQGDKKETARVVGISTKTLYNRLSVYRAHDAARRPGRAS